MRRCVLLLSVLTLVPGGAGCRAELEPVRYSPSGLSTRVFDGDCTSTTVFVQLANFCQWDAPEPLCAIRQPCPDVASVELEVLLDPDEMTPERGSTGAVEPVHPAHADLGERISVDICKDAAGRKLMMKATAKGKGGCVVATGESRYRNPGTSDRLDGGDVNLTIPMKWAEKKLTIDRKGWGTPKVACADDAAAPAPALTCKDGRCTTTISMGSKLSLSGETTVDFQGPTWSGACTGDPCVLSAAASASFCEDAAVPVEFRARPESPSPEISWTVLNLDTNNSETFRGNKTLVVAGGRFQVTQSIGNPGGLAEVDEGEGFGWNWTCCEPVRHICALVQDIRVPRMKKALAPDGQGRMPTSLTRQYPVTLWFECREPGFQLEEATAGLFVEAKTLSGKVSSARLTFVTPPR